MNGDPEVSQLGNRGGAEPLLTYRAAEHEIAEGDSPRRGRPGKQRAPVVSAPLPGGGGTARLPWARGVRHEEARGAKDGRRAGTWGDRRR